MKKIIYSIVVLIAISCQKKQTSPAEEQVTNTTNNSPILYNGFLTAENITTWSSGTQVGNRYFASATLTQTASISAAVNPSYNGTVTLNGTSLKAEQIGTYVSYLDTTNTLNLSTQRNFQLISTTSLPSFMFSNVDAFPTYPATNGYLINDTLFKTQSLVLSLSNTSGYDEASCVIYDISNASNSIVKVVTFGTTQITLSPSDLVNFPIGTTVLCGLSLKKYNTQSFSSKNFRFETSTYNNFYMLVE